MSKFVDEESREMKEEVHNKIELGKQSESASAAISTLVHHVNGSETGLSFGKWKIGRDASLVGGLIRGSPVNEVRNEEFHTFLVKKFNKGKGHYIQSCEFEQVTAWIDLTKLNPHSIKWHGTDLIAPESPESVCKQLLECVKDCSSLEEALGVLAVHDLTRDEAVCTWEMKKLMDGMKKLELMEEEESLRIRKVTVERNKTLLSASIKKKKRGEDEEEMRWSSKLLC